MQYPKYKTILVSVLGASRKSQCLAMEKLIKHLVEGLLATAESHQGYMI